MHPAKAGRHRVAAHTSFPGSHYFGNCSVSISSLTIPGWVWCRSRRVSCFVPRCVIWALGAWKYRFRCSRVTGTVERHSRRLGLSTRQLASYPGSKRVTGHSQLASIPFGDGESNRLKSCGYEVVGWLHDMGHYQAVDGGRRKMTRGRNSGDGLKYHPPAGVLAEHSLPV
jgi:hypothetical protein